MKKIKYNFTIIALLSCMLLSCKKKFEEGPRFSLKSANKRIKGDWELQTLSLDGVDSVQYYNAIFTKECIFTIDPPYRQGDYGTLFIKWGIDTTDIYITRLWPGFSKSGKITANIQTDKPLSYYLYKFSQSWFSKSFDIRYLSNKKLILQIQSNDLSIQRLEFIKI